MPLRCSRGLEVITVRGLARSVRLMLVVLLLQPHMPTALAGGAHDTHRVKRQEPTSSSQARRGMPTGAAQPAAAKSAPSTYHTHPSAGKCSEKSTCFRHRRSRCSLPPDDGHSSWPASRQLKPPVAPQSPHATIRRIRAPRGSYCTTWRKKSHSGPERRGGAKAGEIGLPQPHTKQRD